MDEKTLDLNKEEQTSTESGQSENKVEPETKPESIVEGNKPEVNSEGKIVLSKEEHAKLLEERDNYKKGLLSYKEKAKDVPKDDVLTKTDFQKINEKKAIEAFVKENPDVEEKWTDFVSYYRDGRGRNDVDSIIKDLDDAKTLFLKYNPVKEKDDSKESISELSSDNSLSSTPSDKGGKPEKSGNKFLEAKGKPIQDWYKKVE